ncbi:MAG TPA: DUF5682 family protein, partial [Candidatus Hodarchaeales archaeon]|nr:DUF5682 family protein [Candidatus Hodarchaeales archaeon]
MSEREIPENASSTESGDISALLEAFRKQFYTSSTERCIFVPVRHHSPVCGLQLKELIQNFSPDLILIEGPADGTHLIETLLRNDCRPPVAIYSFFVDHKNKLGLNGRLTPSLGIPFRYASWHPFLSYSPEYVAMKEGMKRKARIEFIDLGLNDRIKVLIKEFSTIDEQKLRTIQTSSQDESSLTESLYIKELVKKTGCRDLNEWWFRSMEIPGIQESPEEFFSKVFTFVAISRSLIKEEVLFFERFREDYMASLITKALAEFPNKKALVVTGGLHTVALFE